MPVGLRFDENVPVSEEEIVRADEGFGDLGRLAGAVLNFLAAVADVHPPARAVAKVLLHHLGTIPGHDEDIANSRGHQPGEDMLQDRFAPKREASA